MVEHSRDYVNAIEDFRKARGRAELRELISRLSGESNQLLSYDEVRQKLRIQGALERGVRDIPLDAIVGSVGRYTDFTRDFLPRRDVQQERWARIKVAASGMAGLPPIDVYKIGEVYFVQDGNHRVSVARELGSKQIQAYVTEIRTPIPLMPDIQPDDLILKAEYSLFLDETGLGNLRPESDLSVTLPGQYPVLFDHIEVHRYYMGIEYQRPVSYAEAVGHWYDHIYIPIIERIRELGILHEFPNRTETDLYVWIAEHRGDLEQELGFSVRTDFVISHLSEEHRQGWFNRIREKLLDLVIPDTLEGGPPTGKWRNHIDTRLDDRLFVEILIPINGKEDGWCALDQAIVVAKRENAILHGLHVTPSDIEDSSVIEQIQIEFTRKCGEAQITGDLVVSKGDVVDQTCLRAAATDLVVVNVSYPPGDEPISRLQSGFRNLLQRSPRPVLATPQSVSLLSKPLLAFDGSPKAREALYVSAYLSNKWRVPLIVVSVEDAGKIGEETLKQAQEYLLEHSVEATYLLERGNPGEVLLQVCGEYDCDWVIMGGYGLNPVFEVILGSTVDKVLRLSKVPTLICR